MAKITPDNKISGIEVGNLEHYRGKFIIISGSRNLYIQIEKNKILNSNYNDKEKRLKEVEKLNKLTKNGKKLKSYE